MNQEDIIKRATGLTVNYGKHFRNPFRADNNPGCFFGKTGKYIRFYDYADERFNGMHCFDMAFVALKGRRLSNKADFLECLELIESKYHIATTPVENKPIVRFKFKLSISPAKWDVAHINFWAQYGITKEHLIEDKVFPAYSYTINSKRKPKSLTTRIADYPAFGLERNGRMKLYQPHGTPKWLNAHRRDDIYYWEGKQPTLVLGSYKDGRIIANTGQSTIALALENSLPSRLPKNSIIIGDFDTAGNKMKKRFVSQGRNALIWESPDPDMKDVGEIYEKYGEDKIYSFVNFAIREGAPTSSRF